MKTYIIKLQHDNGTHSMRIFAKNEEAAIEIVCKAEGCPECAVINIGEIKKRYTWRNGALNINPQGI